MNSLNFSMLNSASMPHSDNFCHSGAIFKTCELKNKSRRECHIQRNSEQNSMKSNLRPTVTGFARDFPQVWYAFDKWMSCFNTPPDMCGLLPTPKISSPKILTIWICVQLWISASPTHTYNLNLCAIIWNNLCHFALANGVTWGTIILESWNSGTRILCTKFGGTRIVEM